MNWQKISTAPRRPLDRYRFGPAIIAWTPDRICVAQWNEDTERWSLDLEAIHDPQPTHWMPLPKAPKSDKS